MYHQRMPKRIGTSPSLQKGREVMPWSSMGAFRSGAEDRRGGPRKGDHAAGEAARRRLPTARPARSIHMDGRCRPSPLADRLVFQE
jgi:hypothetical protein